MLPSFLLNYQIRQTIFGLISPTRPANGSTIEDGYIQKVLIKELGSSREEVDYLIKFYQDYQKTILTRKEQV